jgi:hypothetical protein
MLSISITLRSCDNSLDVNAPYKETTLVYGVLNQSDSTHFFRVSRSFLSSDNALLYINNPDSFAHPYPITVNLKEYDGTNLRRTIPLDTMHILLDSGLFSRDFFVYTYKGAITSTYKYELEVKNTQNDTLIANATTEVVDNFILRGFPTTAQFYDEGAFPSSNVVMLPAQDGFRLDIGYYFYYWDVNETTGVKRPDSIYVKVIQGFKLPGVRNNTEYTFPINGQNFFFAVQGALDPLPEGMHREYDIILRGELAVAGKDLATYIEVNGPSVTLSDVKPRYTNVNKGLGIVSSRFYKYFLMTMSDPSRNFLENGTITGNLGFKN